MDDKNTKSIELSEEEIDLLQELLNKHLDICVSISEEIVVLDLIEKLEF